mgnify:CR=1 FL=1
MISVRIKGKQCDTISDFYAITIPKIKYDHSDKPIRKVEDFYKEFLIQWFQQEEILFIQEREIWLELPQIQCW